MSVIEKLRKKAAQYVCANCKRILPRRYIQLTTPNNLTFAFCTYECLIEYVNREWGVRKLGYY
jgi:hypothetical protein